MCYQLPFRRYFQRPNSPRISQKKVVRKASAFAWFRGILVSGAGIAFLLGCTGNPFDNSKITGGFRHMQGSVRLNDGQSPEDACVWLEGFNLGSRADGAGRFDVTLPPPSAQGVPGGHSGVFKLYFYVANYELAYSQVVLRNGEFAYGQADINKNGELATPQVLRKILRIGIQVTPSVISYNFAEDVYVTVTLQATQDTVTVVFPGQFVELVAKAFLKRLGTEEYYTLLSNSFGAAAGEAVIVGRTPFNLTIAFTWRAGFIPPGEYEVIPYLLVKHEPIPAGLMKSLGDRVEQFGPEYLKIPFRREGGRLSIYGSGSSS